MTPTGNLPPARKASPKTAKQRFRGKLAGRLQGSENLRRCELSECRAACCVYGVWVDKVQVEDILTHDGLISPHLPEGRRNPEFWFDGQEEPDAHALSGRVWHTMVVPAAEHYGGTQCTFLRADYKCALQVAAEAAGMHRWRFKPFYCILHPMDLDDDGRVTLADTPSLLREPGSCLRPSEVDTSLKDIFRPELDYLIGTEPE